MKVLILLISASLYFCHSAHAADTNIETITVVGSHLPPTFTMDRIPKISIDAHDIASLAGYSFVDVLRGIAGIDIFEQGGTGGLTFLSIRGGDPNFVTIIIDGVKVNDPTNSRGGAFDLGTIDPSVIEKIDIFYGGFSTIFGSDALTGVISVQTKSNTTENLGTMSFKVTGNSTLGATAHIGTELMDQAKFNFTASLQDGDIGRFGDAFQRTEFIGSLKSTSQESTHWHVSSFHAYGESQTFPEDSGGDRLAVIRTPEYREFKQTNLSVLLQHELTGALELNMQAAYSRRKEDISSQGIAPGILNPVPAIDSYTDYERSDITMVARYNCTSLSSLAFGINATSENGGMNSFIDFGDRISANYQMKRHGGAIFTEIGFSPMREMLISAGFRYDKTDNMSVTVKRLIARYNLTGSNIVSLHFSEGYKLPSFFALGHPLIGNLSLKPEASKNYDLSFDSLFYQNRLSTRVSFYQNTFTQLVDFDPILFTNVNRSKVRAKGTEISANLVINAGFATSAQISYNNIEVFPDDNTNLRRRPQWKASAQLTYMMLNKISLVARAHFNDDYYDSSIPTGMVKMNGFSRVDVSLLWEVKETMSLRVNVNNLLNSDHEESIGFINTGRNITTSFSYIF